MDALFAVLIAVTVVLTALAIGMVTTISALRAAVGTKAFPAVIALNVLLVPIVGFSILQLFPLTTDAETGVLLCVICAAGPLGLKASQIAKSDLAWALSLTVVLLTLNVVSLPLWSSLLIDRSLTLRHGDLVGVLVVVILVPLVVGAMVGRWRPEPALQWSNLANLASNATLVLAVVVGVVANADGLVESLSSWVFLTTATIISVAGLLGWVIPSDRSRRRVSTLVTMNRATSVALLVIGRAFPNNSETFTAAVVFGLVQTLAVLVLSLIWSRKPAVSVAATT